MSTRLQADCCIVGGGPAGLLAGLLFARAGARTVVLEKHADFLRDFRGDTVHPSTLEIVNELGLLDAFLQRPHQRMEEISVRFEDRLYRVADFRSLPVACGFIAFMPQWDFLDFLAQEAKRLPNFTLLMRHEGTDLIEDGGIVRGVRAEGPDGGVEISANLTIAADGRGSLLRAQAGLPAHSLGAPIDVAWFALPGATTGEHTLINAAAGRVLVTIDRGDYLQCAYVIPKGRYAALQARGIEALREEIGAAFPHLRERLDGLASFDGVSLLDVRVDRMERWSRPGLLFIGDAAHAMSPIGGVGINLAIQDAVAAANLLAPAVRIGVPNELQLDAVRVRRLMPTRITQFVQVQIQRLVLKPIVAGGRAPVSAPLPVRLADRHLVLRRLLGRAIGLGVRPELPHIGLGARLELPHNRDPGLNVTPPPAAGGTR